MAVSSEHFDDDSPAPTDLDLNEKIYWQYSLRGKNFGHLFDQTRKEIIQK